jgi:hypothetical protein
MVVTFMGAGSRDRAITVIQKTVEASISILVSTSLLVGLMYYFGSTRVKTQYQEFGVPASLLDYGNADYLLRSLDIWVYPLRTMLLVFAVASVFAPKIGVAISRLDDRSKTSASQGLAACCVALLLLGDHTFGLAHVLTLSPVEASLLWVAGLVVGFAAAIMSSSRNSGIVGPLESRPARLVLLACWISLFTISVFVLAAHYARSTGLDVAQSVHENRQDLPDVTIVSSSEILATEDGFESRTIFPGNESDILFIYDNVKLLAVGHSHFLVFPGCFDQQSRKSCPSPLEGVSLVAISEVKVMHTRN